jgi:protein phosphatase 1L
VALKIKKDGTFQKLTLDHNLQSETEMNRIRNCGGSIMKVKDSLRLDGVLSVTRAIGGVHFKNSGLSAEPEVTRF